MAKQEKSYSPGFLLTYKQNASPSPRDHLDRKAKNLQCSKKASLKRTGNKEYTPAQHPKTDSDEGCKTPKPPKYFQECQREVQTKLKSKVDERKIIDEDTWKSINDLEFRRSKDPT